MKTVKLKSPAKINVRLDVMGRRHDGFHDLRMINMPIGIYDEIECDLIERGIQVECENDANVPDGEKNIVYGVAKEILAYSNKNVGVRVKIKKVIPSAAGMGGGSSNAASVLMALNDMLRTHLPKEKLMRIGLRFGADVPFFIFGGSAIAEGVGEDLHKIKKMPKLPLVIVSPNILVPTKWVFERFAAANDNKPVRATNVKQEPFADLPKQFATKKSLIKFLNNDLESVTSEKFPVVNEIKALLKKSGALASQMTGSGPSVFGIYSSIEEATLAGKKLQAKLPQCRVFVTESLA